MSDTPLEKNINVGDHWQGQAQARVECSANSGYWITSIYEVKKARWHRKLGRHPRSDVAATSEMPLKAWAVSCNDSG